MLALTHLSSRYFGPEVVKEARAVFPETVVPRDFDIIELKPLGGSILQFLLADIAGNFQDEGGERLLDMLFSMRPRRRFRPASEDARRPRRRAS